MVTALAFLRGPYRIVRAEVALCHAVRVVNRQGSLATPLATDSPRWAHTLAAFIPQPANRFAAASQLLDAADGVGDGRAAFLRGVAHLAGGEPEAALHELEQIPPEVRTTQAWSNLAAAHAALDDDGRDREHWFGILAATRRALQLDATSISARFAQALALERIGLAIPAAAVWRTYLAGAPADRWTAIARQRLARTRTGDDDRSAWARRTQPTMAVDFSALAREFPQQARAFSESLYVCAWADTVVAGDRKAEAAELERIETIADALRLHRGESMIADVAASIRSTRRPRDYAEALQIYRRGRVALRDKKPGDALPDLETARTRFLSLASPMALLSEAYTGVALFELNRYAEARSRLSSLLAAERGADSRHHALIALILYHLALIDGSDGNWNDALRFAEESYVVSLRLGERGNAGVAKALVSESRDLLGQPVAAWTDAVEAIGLLMRAGESWRARIFVAGLSHAELRAKRPESALILALAEQALAGSTVMPEYNCDMHLRRAVAAHALGDTRDAGQWIRRARADAGAVADASIRAKLLADIAAVSGTLQRRDSPHRAIALLSDAISFQLHAQRSVLLPQLYLERSRAHAAAGRMRDAERDVAAGIAQLERQRTRAGTVELRSSLFNDARELFEDAVSIALSRNDVTAALDYVERARARTIVEQMQLGASPPTAASRDDLLPHDRIIVEYAVLDSKIVIFVLDDRHVTATSVAVSRDELVSVVAALRNALTKRGRAEDYEQPAKRLFSWLIAPVAKYVAPARTLVIIPDAILQRIPFHALIDSRTGSYVVERHEVIYAPSAAVYRIASAGLRALSKPLTAVVFANPSLDGTEHSSLAPLPFAEAEGRRIARLYGGICLHGAKATAMEAKRAARDYDVVHFGCHGVSRPREPWKSAIVLARSGSDDGLFSAAHIARMSFPRTQVVVLASCATGDDPSMTVEGAPTVAKAFLIAGVPTVIATLWDVEDGEVGPLVQAFHKALVRGDRPAGALRRAQLEALRSASPELRHAGYWAVFVLTGASD